MHLSSNSTLSVISIISHLFSAGYLLSQPLGGAVHLWGTLLAAISAKRCAEDDSSGSRRAKSPAGLQHRHVHWLSKFDSTPFDTVTDIRNTVVDATATGGQTDGRGTWGEQQAQRDILLEKQQCSQTDSQSRGGETRKDGHIKWGWEKTGDRYAVAWEQIKTEDMQSFRRERKAYYWVCMKRWKEW